VEGNKITDISGKQVEITFQSFQEKKSDDLIRFVERKGHLMQHRIVNADITW
jgi:hypothetical protein